MNVKRKMIRTAAIAGALLAISPPAAGVRIDDRWSLVGDLRAGYFAKYRDENDGRHDRTEEARARIRLGLEAHFTEYLSARLRFAGRYSNQQGSHDGFDIVRSVPETDGLRLGESTLDQAYLEVRPDERWRIRLGRLQTKFELTGVAEKTLDRNDSPNVDITWTDGLHVTRHLAHGWDAHLILQHNAADGPSNVMRKPLDFDDGSSRVTFFAALENNTPWKAVVQRGFDVTYVADALLTDGDKGGRREDYLALVGRLAAQWPLFGSGAKLLLGGELGYAPNTPKEAAVKTGRHGDSGGFASQFSVNFLDIVPMHSLGLVFGYTEAGWLISPDFRSNNLLLEARYRWQTFRNQKLEFRIRLREELERLTGSTERGEETDLFLRYTISF